MDERIENAMQEMIPGHMHGAVRRYVDQGLPPGGFLTAVLCHDLFETFGNADETNLSYIYNWVNFVYNYLPAQCHGNEQRVAEWCSKRGMQQFEQEATYDTDA